MASRPSVGRNDENLIGLRRKTDAAGKTVDGRQTDSSHELRNHPGDFIACRGIRFPIAVLADHMPGGNEQARADGECLSGPGHRRIARVRSLHFQMEQPSLRELPGVDAGVLRGTGLRKQARR